MKSASKQYEKMAVMSPAEKIERIHAMSGREMAALTRYLQKSTSASDYRDGVLVLVLMAAGLRYIKKQRAKTVRRIL